MVNKKLSCRRGTARRAVRQDLVNYCTYEKHIRRGSQYVNDIDVHSKSSTQVHLQHMTVIIAAIKRMHTPWLSTVRHVGLITRVLPRAVASLSDTGALCIVRGPRANGTRIETPKASMRVSSGEGISPSPVGILFPFIITRFDAFCNKFYSSDGVQKHKSYNSQTPD